MQGIDIVSLAASSVFDEKGQGLQLSQLWQKQTTCFIFLRHFACIACRAHVSQVLENREKIEKSGARIVFVGNGQPHFISVFKETMKLGEDVLVLTDPSLKAFKAAGFKRGFLVSHGASSVINGVKLLAQGYTQRMPGGGAGDLWQLGGVLVVQPSGRVAYQFISEALGDFPPEKDTLGI